MVNGSWVTKKHDAYFDPPTEWRKGETGGPILINLIHEIDLLQYLFGPIVRVHVERTLSRRGHVTEEGEVMTLRFCSGAVGSFLICDNTPSAHNFKSGTRENPDFPATGMDFYRIFGTRASLSLPDMRRWSYDGKDESPDWRSALKREDISGAVQKELRPFDLQLMNLVRVIRGEEDPVCDGKTDLSALVSFVAVKEASESGKTVDIR